MYRFPFVRPPVARGAAAAVLLAFACLGWSSAGLGQPAPRPSTSTTDPLPGDGYEQLRRAMRGRNGDTGQGAPAGPETTGQTGQTTPVQGVSPTEIRFGMVGPFSGPAKDLGRSLRIGIETAFEEVNGEGGVAGRRLRLLVADDGYEPGRTGEAMTKLYAEDKVFGFIGNVGTPTAAVATPFALQNGALFFAPLTGANVVRRDPPDRYVFNYRPSYMEETAAAVRYLVNVRRLQPNQIAVFAQDDAYGESGVAGVERALRGLSGGRAPSLLRLKYKRNTIDVAEAVGQLKRDKTVKAVIMVATYRAAAKFIEATRDLPAKLIYTNVSFVGSASLADELMLLGPRFADGVIVTQVVPSVEGSSNAVLGYKKALAKAFPGEKPDYLSFEGYVSAKLLIEGLKRTGPQLTTERLVDELESMRGVDLGLGPAVGFSRTDHQTSHKLWGSVLDSKGKYGPLDLE